MSRKKIIIFLLVILAALFLWKNKSWLVVATVNGYPVPRWDLEKRLVDRFGSQTLDEVVNEQIIFQEGQKKGIKVGDKEIADKVAEIDKSLGGKVSLKDALAGQGLSLEDFKNQIKLQLTLEKLAGSDLVVTDKEITNYIASNSGALTATDEASLKDEAKNILLAQRRNDALRKLFNDLRIKAKVIKFL